ncbi:MAG: hypothetical protein LKI34_05185 [Bifidobacterium tibiigranuli]|uniref:hypothetical protein n=1 Tax=Bifidobacterium tibiigranuli TaxID=2172043 RepID=UPI0026EF2D44|nr:hypothetical protein [Bifidobacterium tibiigranuli]MCI1673592.1 hypothetical protein [Bifidobacterium tibiigranuli]MCI1713813.1 hypothetical protein [Bifidobacterium tibiigranuli]MCI1834616.1 hypothetical protein [Bifidobacterium tibiigranuli]
MNAVRKAAVHGITAHDATVRNGAIRAAAVSIPKTLHVISPLGWIAEAFAMTQISAAKDCAAGCIPGWRIVQHSTLEPARGLADDAIWIAPETLVSLNAWRERQDLEPLMFRAPRPDWPDLLPSDLSGQSMLIATVAEIAAWHELPAGLGPQPWSQLCNGRVAGFNAARRDLDALQSAVSDAPTESNIMLSEHVPGISEEWNVLVHHGVAAAASPYCLHAPPDSHAIVTVFDLPADGLYGISESAYSQPDHPQLAHLQSTHPRPESLQSTYPHWHFHQRYRAIAAQAAERAAAATGTRDASMLIAFRAERDAPIILEIDPVWCSTPYPYDAQGMHAFMESIAEARLLPSARHIPRPYALDNPAIEQQESDSLFIPDPWMVARYANRYRSY